VSGPPVVTVLSGHRDKASAKVVKQTPVTGLPYSTRHWLERNKHGTRLITQTSDPRKNNAWGRAQPSAYAKAGAMYLDEQGQVRFAAPSRYDTEPMRAFLATFEAGLTNAEADWLRRTAYQYENERAA
jgi:hypothetical protein